MKLNKTLAGLIPGSTLNIAKQKREMERTFRDAGHSKSEAVALTAQYFRNKKDGGN